MSTLKQASRGWLLLWFAFLAGASAGSLGQGLYWRLFDGRRIVEGHQAMLADQVGYQISSKTKTWLDGKPGRADRHIGRGRFEPLALVFDGPFFQSHDDNPVQAVLRMNYAHHGALVGEQIADSYLNLAELIAQRHSFLHLLNVQTIPQNVKAIFILGDFGGVPFDSLPQVRDLVFKVFDGSNGDLGLSHIESGTGWETTKRRLDPFTDARPRLIRTRPTGSVAERFEARNLSPGNASFEPGRQANGGLSTEKETL